MLGIGERTFRRWRDRLRDEGPSGWRDRWIGKRGTRAFRARLPRPPGPPAQGAGNTEGAGNLPLDGCGLNLARTRALLDGFIFE
jgi:hypothetical protein